MDFVIGLGSVTYLVGVVALFVRFVGRLFARTTIQWALCFKYAGIVVALLLLIAAASQFLGAGGFWLGVLEILAIHAAVGARYLAPRVIKQSGQRLGSAAGALVGVGAAFLWMGVSVLLLLALAMTGLIRVHF
jgi:hypothetical protein